MNPFAKFKNPFAKFASDVVATTPDGGKVTRMSNGALAFSSPGYSTNDPEAIARIMEGATPLDEAQRTTDDLTIAQNPVAARVQEVNQGAPLVGEWLDEGVEKLGDAIGIVAPETGQVFNRSAETMRRTSDAMERRHPGQSTALNLAGGLAYGGAMLSAVPQYGAPAAHWVGNAGTRLGSATRAGAAVAPIGAVEGAAAMSGRAAPGERGKGAVTGAAVGGPLGLAVGAFAPLVGEGAASLTKRVKKLDVRTIADEFGLSVPAARVVRASLANDDLDAASRYLTRGGDDMMLAEAGPATRQRLDDAMSSGGEALAVARPRIAERAEVQGRQFTGALNDILGTAEGGIKGASKRISQGTASARKAAYDFAYSQPTPMTGAAGQKIEAALGRIPPKVMRNAVEEANDMMRDAGMKNLNIMASIDDATGEVVFSQPLAVAQLDYIGRALGEIADSGTDKLTGAMSGGAMRAANQAKALRDAMKESVTGYARALKIGGDNIANKNALVTGRKLLNPATTIEDVRTVMKGSSDEMKAAARKGLRENIEAVTDRARTTIADLENGAFDFETGANAMGEAVAALRALTTPGNFKKVRMVLGDSESKRLFSEVEKVADVMVLRSAVARNSATAIRTAGREEMNAVTQPGVVRRIAGEAGNPLDAAREGTRALAGTDAATIAESQRRYYGEIADALTRIKGPEARRAIIAVRRAMAGQPMRDADSELIGRLVGMNVSNLGYQAGTRYLAPR